MYVDTEKIYTFGINIGYNSCTAGAQRIRENEKALGCNIPWTVLIHIDTQQFEERRQKYEDLIFEGESLGIYTWMFFASDWPRKTFSLVKNHPDSAFCVFCDTKDITLTFLEEATVLKNLMLVIRYDENFADVCNELRANKMLYSIWYQYGQKDTEIIIDGNLFDSVQELFPIFTVLIPENKCPREVRRLIYSTVKQTRLDQSHSTIAWDLQGDNCLVDTIISEDACSVYFNKDGSLFGWEKAFEGGRYNLFKSSFTDILLNAYPKTGC